MTPRTDSDALAKLLAGATDGPWTAHNMVHEEGRQMTPDEIGEYVANSVRMGIPDRFLFLSGKHDDGGDCDVCHIGNGPKGPHNAVLMSIAPDLARELIALRKERDALRDALFEALNEGLIYWAPNTSRGHERKGDMIDRFEELLLNGVKS